MDVIDEMLLARYGRRCLENVGIYPSIDEPVGKRGTFEVYCYPEEQACEGIFVVEDSDSCEIVGELECGPDPEAE